MDRLCQAGYTEPFTSLEEGVRQYVERLLAHSSQGTREPPCNTKI